MNIISKNIKYLRTKNGLSQQELGEILGVSDKAVSTWELGYKSPRMGVIEKLSQHFNIPKSKIIDDDLSNPNIQKSEYRQIGIPYNPIVHKIPVLGYISAGLPLYADEHIEDYTYTERNGGAEYFALRVKGDSMNAAQINDGNMVIVRVQPVIENGEIAVVRVNGDNATVKRFKKDGNVVQLIPQSYNPEHQIQIYDLKDTQIEIIGKVVECKIEF